MSERTGPAAFGSGKRGDEEDDEPPKKSKLAPKEEEWILAVNDAKGWKERAERRQTKAKIEALDEEKDREESALSKNTRSAKKHKANLKAIENDIETLSSGGDVFVDLKGRSTRSSDATPPPTTYMGEELWKGGRPTFTKPFYESYWKAHAHDRCVTCSGFLNVKDRQIDHKDGWREGLQAACKALYICDGQVHWTAFLRADILAANNDETKIHLQPMCGPCNGSKSGAKDSDDTNKTGLGPTIIGKCDNPAKCQLRKTSDKAPDKKS